jgi:hypothetical protein
MADRLLAEGAALVAPVPAADALARPHRCGGGYNLYRPPGPGVGFPQAATREWPATGRQCEYEAAPEADFDSWARRPRSAYGGLRENLVTARSRSETATALRKRTHYGSALPRYDLGCNPSCVAGATSVEVDITQPSQIAAAVARLPVIRDLGADVVRRMISDSPLGSLGIAAAVAQLVAWLCSEASSPNTGAVFDMSGERARY